MSNIPPPDALMVPLKNPPVAALLAWLLPGWGHWYQGRRAKAVLYFVCIMGLFVLGISLSSSRRLARPGGDLIGVGRAVYLAWNPEDHHLPYFCQIGVGLPAMPAIVQAYRMSNRQRVWWGGFMAPAWPSEQSRQRVIDADALDPNVGQPTLDDLNGRLKRDFDLATFFTMIAGLLNILVIYDAWAGPVESGTPAGATPRQD